MTTLTFNIDFHKWQLPKSAPKDFANLIPAFIEEYLEYKNDEELKNKIAKSKRIALLTRKLKAKL